GGREGLVDGGLGRIGSCWRRPFMLIVIKCADYAGHNASPPHAHEREDDLQAAADKLAHHLLESQVRLLVSGPESMVEKARSKLQEMAGSFGLFSFPRLGSFRVSARYESGTSPCEVRGRPFLLSTEEL